MQYPSRLQEVGTYLTNDQGAPLPISGSTYVRSPLEEYYGFCECGGRRGDLFLGCLLKWSTGFDKSQCTHILPPLPCLENRLKLGKDVILCFYIPRLKEGEFLII